MYIKNSKLSIKKITALTAMVFMMTAFSASTMWALGGGHGAAHASTPAVHNAGAAAQKANANAAAAQNTTTPVSGDSAAAVTVSHGSTPAHNESAVKPVIAPPAPVVTNSWFGGAISNALDSAKGFIKNNVAPITEKAANFAKGAVNQGEQFAENAVISYGQTHKDSLAGGIINNHVSDIHAAGQSFINTANDVVDKGASYVKENAGGYIDVAAAKVAEGLNAVEITAEKKVVDALRGLTPVEIQKILGAATAAAV